MNFAPAPLQYVRDVWQGILNEIKRVDGQENAKRDRANTFRGDQTIKGNLTATNLSGTNTGDVTLAGETYLTIVGQQITAAKITEAQQNTSDVATANVSSAKHGYAPKSPADTTQFLNGAATPAFAQVKDSDLSTSDITNNNSSSTKHGFAPKSPADATQFLNGAATPAYAQVKDSDLSTSDITANNVSTTKHGFAPKAPNDATKFLDGTGAYSTPTSAAGANSQSTPVDPATTTNTTGVMMGLAGSITPSKSGNVLIVVSGRVFNSVGGAKFQIRTGTGSAPANGAALTGTARGAQISISASSLNAPFGVNALVTGLALSTAVWIDLSLAEITNGPAGVGSISISAIEQ